MSEQENIFRAFNRTQHNLLWSWLAEHPEKQKWDWPGWQANGGTVEETKEHCFACEYVSERDELCNKCPLEWPEQMTCGSSVLCANTLSLFGRWNRSCDTDVRASLAEQIANLPIKPGVMCI